jgi:hypothetical protein
MAINIIEYKKTILEMFNSLTDFDMKAAVAVLKEDPEKNSDMSMSYMLAIKRCREILKIILEGKTDE